MQQRFGTDAAGIESKQPYKTLISSFQRIWTLEGLRGFYKGFAANILRVAPQSALTLTAYEGFRSWMEGLDKTRHTLK